LLHDRRHVLPPPNLPTDPVDQLTSWRRSRPHQKASRIQPYKLVELRRTLVMALVVNNPKRPNEAGSELLPRRFVTAPVRLWSVHVQPRGLTSTGFSRLLLVP